jgi:hypothetical protein
MEAIVLDTDTVSRKEFEELRDSIRDLRRLFITGNGGSSNPAPATPTADAAQLLAIEDLTDKVAALNRQLAGLPAMLADEIEDRYIAVEEDEGGPSPKATSKAKTKTSADEDKLDEEPKRRGFFPDS